MIRKEHVISKFDILINEKDKEIEIKDEDGTKELIQKGHFLGLVKNGFVYKKYIPEAKNREGNICVKTLKE